ncbi:tetratricopeptide repeat protein [Lignipirellula cremea]|uniref:Lipoprotein NlpI n=1 Tax=Lignipirellula cremea TaxID=2528010 RepID=A0A518DUK7_9BACT|nr:tetratricopeptide repeat protein [Lignipirellula cremea]QDU95523.1 lipoprotein NlpI [Lignipirellula cremea]
MRYLIVGSLALALFASTAEARKFTNATTGVSIEATYLGVKDGKIILQLESGKLHSVPANVFTAEDQAYFKEIGPTGEKLLAAPPSDEPVKPATAPLGDDRFSQAISENPNNASAWIARGMVLTKDGKAELAVADFNRALELEPKNPSAWNGRGKAYMTGGDAAAAHRDFSQAIELDEKFVPAYRNRADNAVAYYKTPAGQAMIEEELAKARKKRDAIERVYQQKFPWQPRHSTTDKSLSNAALDNLVMTDRMYAERYQRDWERSHDIDYGVSGGIHVGGGVAVGAGVVLGQAGTVVLNPALAVYPLKAQVGETITLVANPSQLAAGMQVIGKGANPNPEEGAQATPEQIAAVKMVDFYRDVNGNGQLEKDQDQYLATDPTSSDGFSTEVPTGDFNPGTQTYFAVPKGDGTSPSGEGSATLILSQSLLAAAAKAERNIADQAGRGASAGLSAADADALGREQSDVAKIINDIAKKVKGEAPELAQQLLDLRPQVGQASGQLRAAKNSPGDGSKAAAGNAATSASGVAQALENASVELAKLTGTYEEPASPGEGEGAGEGSGEGEGAGPGEGQPKKPPTDEQYAGAPGAASGELTPAPGKPGGPGGPGDGVVINNNYGDDDDNGGIVINNDLSDDDDLAYRARGYAEDGDYDAALLDYDRVLARRPDDVRLLRDRADTLIERGSYDRAVLDYDRMIKMAPRNADFYYNRGCAHLAAGDIEAGISDFTMSIQLDELGKLGNLAYNNRGSAYARLSKFELAIADFDKAIEITPTESLAYRNRALALKLLGRSDDYEKAIIRYREVESTQVVLP